MSKELNIIEAIEMPVGTVFKVITEINVELENVILDNLKRFRYLDNNYEIKNYSNEFIKAKFIPIQKSVPFMEAAKSGKKIKVNHEDIYRNEEYFNEYHELGDLLHELTECFNNVQGIILNGEWYIEED